MKNLDLCVKSTAIMALNSLNYTTIPQETLLNIYMSVRGAEFSHVIDQIQTLRTKGRDDVVAILFRLMREEDYQNFMRAWTGPANHFKKHFEAQESIFANVPILFPTMAKQALQRATEALEKCMKQDEPAPPTLPTRRKLKRSNGADDAIVRSAKRVKPLENDGVDARPQPDTAKQSSKRDRDEAGSSTDSPSDAENREAKKARINTSQGEEFVAIAKNDDPTRAEETPVKSEPAD